MPLHTPIIVTYDKDGDGRARRRKSIGASESPALIERLNAEDPLPDEENDEHTYTENGQTISPYGSLFQLAMLKLGRYKISRRADTARQKMGRLQEPAIIQYIVDDKQWTAQKPPHYYMHPTVAQMGAQIDHEVLENGELIPLEIKQVGDTERWKWINEAGNKIVPLHIQIQAQHQMSVTGTPKAYIGVCFGGYDVQVFEILRDNELIAEIEGAVADFWENINAGNVPVADPVRDAKILNKLYQVIEPDGVLDWSEDTTLLGLIENWRACAARESSAKKEKERLNMELKERLAGNAMATLGGGMILKMQTIDGTVVPETKREGYTKLQVVKEPVRHSGRATGRGRKSPAVEPVDVIPAT